MLYLNNNLVSSGFCYIKVLDADSYLIYSRLVRSHLDLSRGRTIEAPLGHCLSMISPGIRLFSNFDLLLTG